MYVLTQFSTRMDPYPQ